LRARMIFEPGALPSGRPRAITAELKDGAGSATATVKSEPSAMPL
jgi:hypothetical protein